MGTEVFSAVEQPDVAHLDNDGVSYRCYLYVNRERATVESSLFVEQEDGQSVLVDQRVIWTPADIIVALDCPRLIARGRHFIAHWLDGRGYGLYRGILDVEDISSGWSTFMIDEIGPERLYDVDVVLDNDTDFVLVSRTTTAGQIRVMRVVEPWGLADLEYNQTHVFANLTSRVLGISPADDTQDRVLIAFEADDLSGDKYLHVFPVVATTGASAGSALAPFSVDADCDYANVGICRLNGDDWMVIAECRPPGTYTDVDIDRRELHWATIDGDAGSTSDTCIAPNLHLVSRPWTWASSYVDASLDFGVNAYAFVTYKNMALGSQWEQSFGFVLNLDVRNLDNGTQGVPCSAVMNGSIDGRPSGESRGTMFGGGNAYIGTLSDGQRDSWKRINHLSHVSGPPLYELGPDRKTVVIAALAWSRIMAGNVISTPANTPFAYPGMAAVRGYRFYHEDPWMLDRDDKEPSLPTTLQYKGAHHRPIAYPAEISGALVFGGGVTQVFDGAQLVELGFFWAPEIIDEDPADEGEGATYQYWYVATYAWTDAKGQLHRSPPSSPIRVGRSTVVQEEDGTTLTIRTMTISMKDSDLHYLGASPINIELWRTYYEDGSIAEDSATGTFLLKRVFTGTRGNEDMHLRETPVNNRAVWAQDILDEQVDAIVSISELLPWQLDTSTLQWSPPAPKAHTPLSVVANWQNRLWGVNPEDPRLIEYSEEILPYGTQYVMPEFNSVNSFRFDSHGDVTAMHPMDNALIVFTRDAIYALSGDGNSGGVSGSLRLQTLAEGTGCIEPRSIVLGPPGIFFQSAKGYYLLGRGYDLDYITAGAAIEDLIREAGNVRAATLLEDRHQIRLTLNEASRGNPRVAIYDYFHRLWSVAEPQRMGIGGWAANPRFHDMQGATWWRGISGETLHVFLQQGGGVGVERASSDTTFADDRFDGSNSSEIAVPMDVTVEWIHLAGISGYKKLRSIGIQLEKSTDVEVTVELWYDRNGDYAEGTADDTFTDNASRGYVRVRPSIRKCTAVLIRVYESGDGSGGGVPATQNLKITGLALEVGLKKGPRRVADNQVGA